MFDSRLERVEFILSAGLGTGVVTVGKRQGIELSAETLFKCRNSRCMNFAHKGIGVNDHPSGTGTGSKIIAVQLT